MMDKNRLKEYLIEMCCVYTIISVVGAVTNIFLGTETNNINVIVMFVTCAIATFVLFMHKLFDNVSPLLMIVIQYLVACSLIGLVLFVISTFVDPITPRGWFEFYRSFTIPYIFFAAFYYYRVFREAKKQDEMIKQIQQDHSDCML